MVSYPKPHFLAAPLGIPAVVCPGDLELHEWGKVERCRRTFKGVEVIRRLLRKFRAKFPALVPRLKLCFGKMSECKLMLL